jgi:hypothetical protein
MQDLTDDIHRYANKVYCRKNKTQVVRNQVES